jgi:crooked neck
VWLSFAQFEASNPLDAEKCKENARGVYKKAYNELKNASNKESRVMVLEAWKEFEVI